VEIATARSFILNRGIATDTMSATPLEPGSLQCIPLHQGCCQPGRCPVDGLVGLWGLTGWHTGAKALYLYSQSPQACKPIRRAPTWLTTALVKWNALQTILAPGVWQTLCQSVQKTLQLLFPPERGLLKMTHRYIN